MRAARRTSQFRELATILTDSDALHFTFDELELRRLNLSNSHGLDLAGKTFIRHYNLGRKFWFRCGRQRGPRPLNPTRLP